MTPEQLQTLRLVLEMIQPDEAHHGDCIHADAQFHAICQHYGIKIVVHPPVNTAYRAWCDGPHTTILEPKPYIPRNHDIVDVGHLLIAGPHQPEYLRSGTWSTVRYARKQKKQTIILEAHGNIDWELTLQEIEIAIRFWA